MEDLLPIWLTTTASVVGVVYAIVRNGSRKKKQDADLKADLKADMRSIKEQLGDPITGLDAISNRLEKMREHCNDVTSAMNLRVKENSKDIEHLLERRHNQ
ncbi:MAG: hypothetical protein PHE15_02870 [Dehalococcoidales bacterium]|nr:hypothetical protein [Dehalococcoidales bacterium]